MKTFSEFQEAAAAVKALPTIAKAFTKVAPMVAPKLQTFAKFSTAIPVGLAGASAMLQAKRSQDTKASRGRRSEKPKRKLSRMAQKQIEIENKRGEKLKNTDPNKGISRKRETFNNPTNLSKPEDEFHTNEFQPDKSMTEEAPTNSVGGGQIAGTVEAGDDPPKKKKKKKTYAYGGRGSRKMWMNNK